MRGTRQGRLLAALVEVDLVEIGEVSRDFGGGDSLAIIGRWLLTERNSSEIRLQILSVAIGRDVYF